MSFRNVYIGGVFILSEIEVVVFVWREGKWFVAYEPSSGVASQGETVDEALNNLREALELYLEEKQDIYPIERVMITRIKVKLPVSKNLPHTPFSNPK